MNDNGFCGPLGPYKRHVEMQNVIGNDNTLYAEINLDELNQLILLNDGWLLNQSNCKYIPPQTYTLYKYS